MANLYVLLKSANPAKPRHLGTVAAIHANGTATVDLFEGGSLTVLGDGFPVGSKVFVVGDAIEGKAPDLSILPKVFV